MDADGVDSEKILHEVAALFSGESNRNGFKRSYHCLLKCVNLMERLTGRQRNSIDKNPSHISL